MSDVSTFRKPFQLIAWAENVETVQDFGITQISNEICASFVYYSDSDSLKQ